MGKKNMENLENIPSFDDMTMDMGTGAGISDDMTMDMGTGAGVSGVSDTAASDTTTKGKGFKIKKDAPPPPTSKSKSKETLLSAEEQMDLQRR